MQLDQNLEVQITVGNTGKRQGTEIVQLYVEDLVTSCTWASRELKAYARVALQPGESRVVQLKVAARELSIVDTHGVRRCEPGEFRVHVGSSSRPADCLSADFELK